eukprot:3592358-Prymnesium_polylepis.1
MRRESARTCANSLHTVPVQMRPKPFGNFRECVANLCKLRQIHCVPVKCARLTVTRELSPGAATAARGGVCMTVAGLWGMWIWTDLIKGFPLVD